MIILILAAALFWGMIWGLVTYALMKSKHYSDNVCVKWFFMGFFFGIIGVIVAITEPTREEPKRRKITKKAKWEDLDDDWDY